MGVCVCVCVCVHGNYSIHYSFFLRNHRWSPISTGTATPKGRGHIQGKELPHTQQTTPRWNLDSPSTQRIMYRTCVFYTLPSKVQYQQLIDIPRPISSNSSNRVSKETYTDLWHATYWHFVWSTIMIWSVSSIHVQREQLRKPALAGAGYAACYNCGWFLQT